MRLSLSDKLGKNDKGSMADGDLGIVVTPVALDRRNDRVFRTERMVLM